MKITGAYSYFVKLLGFTNFDFSSLFNDLKNVFVNNLCFRGLEKKGIPFKYECESDLLVKELTDKINFYFYTDIAILSVIVVYIVHEFYKSKTKRVQQKTSVENFPTVVKDIVKKLEIKSIKPETQINKKRIIDQEPCGTFKKQKLDNENLEKVQQNDAIQALLALSIDTTATDTIDTTANSSTGKISTGSSKIGKEIDDFWGSDFQAILERDYATNYNFTSANKYRTSSSSDTPALLGPLVEIELKSDEEYEKIF